MTIIPCKFCGRKMTWAISPNGKRIPLAPVKTVYQIKQEGEELKAVPISDLTGELFVSHFIDCLKLDELRKDHA